VLTCSSLLFHRCALAAFFSDRQLGTLDGPKKLYSLFGHMKDEAGGGLIWGYGYRFSFFDGQGSVLVSFERKG